MAFDLEFYEASAKYVRSKIDFEPELAIVLGTGLGPIAGADRKTRSLSRTRKYRIFFSQTVSSHAGKLILGTLEGKRIVCNVRPVPLLRGIQLWSNWPLRFVCFAGSA
jgi:purine-nucleoside phosphorylase